MLFVTTSTHFKNDIDDRYIFCIYTKKVFYESTFYPIPESQSLHTHELRKILYLRLTLVPHGEGCGHTFDPMPESQSLHTHDGDHRSFHSTGYDWINSVSSLWDTIESLNDLESMSSYEHILLNIGTLHFSGKKKEGKKSLKIMKKRRNAF